jgi:murein L,D-transpeptidase YcbB/YkuD
LLRTGDRSPDVAWLREQLEIALGVKMPSPDPHLFDYPLKSQVLEFQRSRGLVVDGVVGKNTLLQLNSSIGGDGVPVLQPVAVE